MTLNEALEALRFDLESYLAGADGREHEAVRTLVAAVDRVRDLHRISPVAPSYDPYCGACRYDDGWPCPTIRALEGMS